MSITSLNPLKYMSMRLSHRSMTLSAALVWLGVGGGLGARGLRELLLGNLQMRSFLYSFSFLAEHGIAIRLAILLCCLVVAVVLGTVKSRFILRKTMIRTLKRLYSKPSPVAWHEVYTWRYFVLIGAMIGFGVTLRALGVDPLIRGTILTAVGWGMVRTASIPWVTLFKRPFDRSGASIGDMAFLQQWQRPGRAAQ